MMGLSPVVYWMSWFAISLIYLVIACFIFTLLLSVKVGVHGSVLGKSDPTLTFVFFLCYAMSVIALSFMISTFFKKGMLIWKWTVHTMCIFLFIFWLFSIKNWNFNLKLKRTTRNLKLVNTIFFIINFFFEECIWNILASNHKFQKSFIVYNIKGNISGLPFTVSLWNCITNYLFDDFRALLTKMNQ